MTPTRTLPRLSHRHCLVCLLGLLAVVTPAAAEVEYFITSLGELGGTQSGAYDINNAGVIAGRAEAPDGWFHAVRWLKPETPDDLGTLGGLFSEAWGINESGQIVGHSHVLPGGGAHAFRYDPWMGMVYLGALGGEAGNANRINDAGVAVGWSELADGSTHATIWDATNQPFDLGTFGGTQSEALDINAAGHIVGWATTRADNQGDEQMRAFIYDGGELVPLGPAGARASSAQAINEAGQVIGFSTSYAEYMTAFLWDEQQGLQDLGNLGGDTIIPWGINNAASPVAVGFADDAQSEGVAFVWDAAHGVRDLNALIPADSGWIRLREARGINDAGQIVGYGLRMDGWHAFLLTPVPEPTAALGLLLAASLSMRHRRRA